MGVNIDEAGRDDQIRSIEFPLRRVDNFSNGNDPSVLHRDVAVERRISGSIDNPTVANHEVVRLRVREEHVRVHELMSELKIPHVYKDGPQRKHDWHSGWVSEAALLLMQNEKRE